MVSTPSRKVLSTPELLSLILEGLGNPKVDSGVASTLVSCARVSKAWSYGAIPIIWNSCKDVAVGLFGLLDSLDTSTSPLRYVSRERQGNKFTGWPRFYHYMSKIRTLELSLLRSRKAPADKTSSRTWIHPDVIRAAAMVAESHGKGLCAMVQKWTITLCEPEACEVLVNILHAPAESLEITWLRPAMDIDASSFRAVFIRLQHMCPNLSNLSIDYDIPHTRDAFKAEIPAALRKLQKLRTLTLSPYLALPSIWKAIQRSSATSLHFPRAYPRIAMDHPVSALPTHMETLELSIQHEHLSQLLEAPRSDALSVLALVIHKAKGGDHFPSLFDKLVDLAPNLGTLALSISGSPRLPKPIWFQPLSRVSLTSVDLYIDGVDDSHFGVLVSSCPSLVELKVRPMSSDGVPGATIASLATIAQHCREIERITVRLDCRLETLPDKYQKWVGFSDTLTELNMEYSPIENPADVAGIICHLFRSFTIDITAEGTTFAGYHTPRYRPAKEQMRLVRSYESKWEAVNFALWDIRALLNSRDVHSSCRSQMEATKEELQAELAEMRIEAEKLREDKIKSGQAVRELRAEARKAQAETKKLQNGTKRLQKRVDDLEREVTALRATGGEGETDPDATLTGGVNVAPPQKKREPRLSVPIRASGRLAARRGEISPDAERDAVHMSGDDAQHTDAD